VIYPGSIERTSFAERNEDKHYVRLGFSFDGSSGGQLTEIHFVELPTRPMVSMDISPASLKDPDFESYLKSELSKVDPDAIVRLRIRGEVSGETAKILSAPILREIAPATMNISIRMAN
jgi:DNA repair exonuclease SbcCD nuclease subunit